MATVYNIKIKTVSPWCRYGTEQVKKIVEKLFNEYANEDTQQRFENTEVSVEEI